MCKLINIQQKLKAPKNQKNSFGGYNYRSCEDILEAVKPILSEENAYLILNDEIIFQGDRYYIKATANLFDAENKLVASSTAYAREAENKKGMDESQITGAASSYARKYALNGLFAIDDTKDADATNTHDKQPTVNKKTQKETVKEVFNGKEVITDDDKGLIAGCMACKTVEELNEYYKEILPVLTSDFAKQLLIKRCKEVKEKING